MKILTTRNVTHIIDQVAKGLAEAGIVSSIDDAKPRRIGEDEFTLQAMLDPEREHAIEETVAWIVAKAEARPIVFSPLTLPFAIECAVRYTRPSRSIVARYLRAYDVQEDRIIARIDFLFKCAA